MKNLFARMLLILACATLFPGCAGKAPLPPWASRISMVKAPVGPEEIFSLPEGDPITFAQLLNDLDTTRVIFVGESHDQIEHHQIQVRMIHDLVAKGKDVVIGMEMFEKSQQATLDRWSQGLLTEEEFLEESQWEKTWGMDHELYKGILDAAKTRHLKILGLNVPRDWVRTVAGNGMQGLSPEDRKLLPEIDLANRQHRAYIATIFKGHEKGSAKAFENFYEAQCLWDEGMAQSLSEFLESPQSEGKTVLVFAGSGHIVFGFGIPNRLDRRNPVPYQAIVLKTWSKKMNGDLSFTGASSPLANFLWITKPNPPEKKKPRIGVILKTKEDVKGLIIDQVFPRSPAEKAGLLPGDQLIAVEGIEIKEVKEIHHALSEKGWGNDITFTILREGKQKEIAVQLPPLED
ncbi:MAG: hypothetical protein H6Q41_703 [Deltaproteobacteria bacterium]|jgi:uncharacterized iron-regulated protein|nr:hypothetical protein [Deltaproteobacteria bacterium]